VYKLADQHTLEGLAMFINQGALAYAAVHKAAAGEKLYLVCWIENMMCLDRKNWLMAYHDPETALKWARAFKPQYNLLVEIEPTTEQHPRSCIKSVHQL
jgi:hypothetical protein